MEHQNIYAYQQVQTEIVSNLIQLLSADPNYLGDFYIPLKLQPTCKTFLEYTLSDPESFFDELDKKLHQPELVETTWQKILLLYPYAIVHQGVNKYYARILVINIFHLLANFSAADIRAQYFFSQMPTVSHFTIGIQTWYINHIRNTEQRLRNQYLPLAAVSYSIIASIEFLRTEPAALWSYMERAEDGYQRGELYTVDPKFLAEFTIYHLIVVPYFEYRANHSQQESIEYVSNGLNIWLE